MCEFEALVREHQTVLLTYATRLIADRHRAEDVVQEAWIRAWRHRSRLTEECGSVRAWLLRVVHNVVVDQSRARNARPCEVVLNEDKDHMVSNETVDTVLNRMVVRDVLSVLPRPHRDVVTSRYLQDHSTAETAAELSIPVGTVKSRIHIAINSMRASLSGAAA